MMKMQSELVVVCAFYCVGLECLALTFRSFYSILLLLLYAANRNTEAPSINKKTFPNTINKMNGAEFTLYFKVDTAFIYIYIYRVYNYTYTTDIGHV